MNDIVLMCGRGQSSAAVANALEQAFGPVPILVERKEPRSVFLRRRVRRLGLWTVTGQILFTALVVPLLRRISRSRIGAIAAAAGLDFDDRPLEKATHVVSVNDAEALEWLRSRKPRVVVINGTRIIAKRILDATDATFINLHAGITPEYRGAHGGYWALRAGDRANSGVTVHLVDSGIDTGDIVGQQRIAPGPRDNFATYPVLQLAAGLPMLIEAVRAALSGSLRTEERPGSGAIWYHPTLWQYVATGLRSGVW